LDGLRQLDYQGKVAVSAPTQDEAERFAGLGVNMVLVPYADAAKEAAERLWRDSESQKPAEKGEGYEAI
jgi:hypothetical protein